MTGVHYLDSSALVKLVVRERESDALLAWLTTRSDLITADLSRTELARAVRRSAPDRMPAAKRVLDSLTILRVGTSAFEAAGRLDPTTLRSLDAIHLSVALSIGDELESIVTYDERMTDAATLLGVAAEAPG